MACALIAGVVARSDGGDPRPSPSGGDGVGHDGGWRTEYWQDVAVDVPADWGYGGAPYQGRLSRPQACAPAVGPTGWVGRPVMSSDLCVTYPWRSRSRATADSAPYVWLGAAVDPGEVSYTDDFVEKTILVGGTTVTVGSDDAELRRQILASVRTGAAPCPASLAGMPAASAGWTKEGRGEFVSGSVCAFRPDQRGGFELVYAASLDERSFRATSAAVDAAPVVTRRCDETGEVVLVGAEFEDPFGSHDLHASMVLDLACQGSVTAARPWRGPRQHEVTPDVVAPWAVGGVPEVVRGPAHASGLSRYLIGPQG